MALPSIPDTNSYCKRLNEYQLMGIYRDMCAETLVIIITCETHS